MDIDYLLSLQEFRNGSGGILSDFFSKMTFLGELNTALVVMAILYWCVHKELGTFLLMGFGGNRLVNGVLKITACIYRPWIRDARIAPPANVLATATGYSFPSGHSMNAASLFGGGALRKELPWVCRILLVILMLLVAFSRNYLGVHTPQDVAVGMAAGVLEMWLMLHAMRWIAAHPEKDWWTAAAGLLLCVAVAVYALVKSFPEDYDAEGKLIVEGAKMANDTFKGVGYAAGIFSGWLLERRLVGFSTEASLPVKLTRGVTGLLGYYIVSLICVPLIKKIPGPAGTLLSCFLQTFWILFLFPLCVKFFEKKMPAGKPLRRRMDWIICPF